MKRIAVEQADKSPKRLPFRFKFKKDDVEYIGITCDRHYYSIPYSRIKRFVMSYIGKSVNLCYSDFLHWIAKEPRLRNGYWRESTISDFKDLFKYKYFILDENNCIQEGSKIHPVKMTIVYKLHPDPNTKKLFLSVFDKSLYYECLAGITHYEYDYLSYHPSYRNSNMGYITFYNMWTRSEVPEKSVVFNPDRKIHKLYLKWHNRFKEEDKQKQIEVNNFMKTINCIPKQRKCLVYSNTEFIELMKRFKWFDGCVSKQYAIISICDPAPENNQHWFKRNTENVLNLDFYDISGYYFHGIKGLTNEQAKILFNFIENNIGRTFIVHCAAGISRSQAIAKYLIDIYPELYSTESLRADNPCEFPNPHVVSLLKHLKYDN